MKWNVHGLSRLLQPANISFGREPKFSEKIYEFEQSADLMAVNGRIHIGKKGTSVSLPISISYCKLASNIRLKTKRFVLILRGSFRWFRTFVPNFVSKWTGLIKFLYWKWKQDTVLWNCNILEIETFTETGNAGRFIETGNVGREVDVFMQYCRLVM